MMNRVKREKMKKSKKEKEGNGTPWSGIVPCKGHFFVKEGENGENIIIQ
jgi:hypothetical protein